MKRINFLSELQHREGENPAAKMLLETDFTKEIRIVFREGQFMKEHKAGYPIVIEVLEGAIDFGVNGEMIELNQHDMITLSANVPHDLKALKDSIVRLTLSKLDTVDRVQKVVE